MYAFGLSAMLEPLRRILISTSFKAVFQLRVFHTCVHARETLNPSQYYI